MKVITEWRIVFLKHTEDRVRKLFTATFSFRIRYKFYVFEISKQKDNIAAQPVCVEFTFCQARHATIFTE